MRQKAQAVAAQPKHVLAEQNSKAKYTTGDAVGKEVIVDQCHSDADSNER